MNCICVTTIQAAPCTAIQTTCEKCGGTTYQTIQPSQPLSGAAQPAPQPEKPTHHIIGCARTIQTAVLVVEYLKRQSPDLKNLIEYRFKNPTPENGCWSADIFIVQYHYPDVKTSSEIDKLVGICRAFVAGRGEIWT